jgi:hypothetical protein
MHGQQNIKFVWDYFNIAKCALVPVEVKNNTHIFVYCYWWNGTTNPGKLLCYRVIGGLVLLMSGWHNGFMLPKFKSFLFWQIPFRCADELTMYLHMSV